MTMLRGNKHGSQSMLDSKLRFVGGAPDGQAAGWQCQCLSRGGFGMCLA